MTKREGRMKDDTDVRKIVEVAPMEDEESSEDRRSKSKKGGRRGSSVHDMKSNLLKFVEDEKPMKKFSSQSIVSDMIKETASTMTRTISARSEQHETSYVPDLSKAKKFVSANSKEVLYITDHGVFKEKNNRFVKVDNLEELQCSTPSPQITNSKNSINKSRSLTDRQIITTAQEDSKEDESMNSAFPVKFNPISERYRSRNAPIGKSATSAFHPVNSNNNSSMQSHSFHSSLFNGSGNSKLELSPPVVPTPQMNSNNASQLNNVLANNMSIENAFKSDSWQQLYFNSANNSMALPASLNSSVDYLQNILNCSAQPQQNSQLDLTFSPMVNPAFVAASPAPLKHQLINVSPLLASDPYKKGRDYDSNQGNHI